MGWQEKKKKIQEKLEELNIVLTLSVPVWQPLESGKLMTLILQLFFAGRESSPLCGCAAPSSCEANNLHTKRSGASHSPPNVTAPYCRGDMKRGNRCKFKVKGIMGRPR